MRRVTVRTASRLHFGLLGWGPHSPRQFGSLGLMIDEPGTTLRVEPAAEWAASGPLAERCLAVARTVAQALPGIGPARIETLETPPEHVGLGVGTQLSLAVARGLTRAYGHDDLTTAALARLTGRGQRSGVGIHGFERGGLIVDAGPRQAGAVPTLLTHVPFPPLWSVLLVLPRERKGLHGPDEVRAFHRLNDAARLETDRLARLLLLGILPAVLETDLPTFGAALSEFQEVVGHAFAPVQGGRFASPETEQRRTELTQAGLVGVGQSSWGPTLYGFTDRDAPARAALTETLEKRWAGRSVELHWTRASDAGVRVAVEGGY